MKKEYIEFDDIDDLKYLILKTTNKVKKERAIANNILDEDVAIYLATRYSWKLQPKRARKCKYVFGVINGIVRGIYQPKEWVLSDNGERYEFNKEDITIDESVTKRFLGKRIPSKYRRRGMSNPVLYHD